MTVARYPDTTRTPHSAPLLSLTQTLVLFRNAPPTPPSGDIQINPHCRAHPFTICQVGFIFYSLCGFGVCFRSDLYIYPVPRSVSLLLSISHNLAHFSIARRLRPPLALLMPVLDVTYSVIYTAESDEPA